MNIIVGSKFNPFTYDELMKPVRDYTEAYNKVYDLYLDISDLTAYWNNIVSLEDENSDVYKNYNAYSLDLNRIVDDFSRGMTPLTRKDLMNMRRRFNKEIKPIETAYNTRLQHIQLQMEGKAKGMVYDTDAASTSLDAYMKNPSLVHQGVSSVEGFSRMATVGQALSKSIANALITGHLDDYTKSLMTKYGYEVDDVQLGIAEIMNDIQGLSTGQYSSKGAKMFSDILSNELRAAGILDWSEGAKMEYLGKVSPALYNAVGQMTITPMEDVKARSQLSLSNQIAASDHAFHQEMLKMGLKYNDKTKQWEKDLNIIDAIADVAKAKKTKLDELNTPSGSSGTTGTQREYTSQNMKFEEKNSPIIGNSTADMPIEGSNFNLTKKVDRTKYNNLSNDITMTVEDELGNAIGWLTDKGELYMNKDYEYKTGTFERKNLFDKIKNTKSATWRGLLGHRKRYPGEEGQYLLLVDTDGNLYSISNDLKIVKGEDNNGGLLDALLKGRQ